MSYLTGPLARGQIKKLMAPRRAEIAAILAAAPAPDPETTRPRRPSFPKGVREFFVPLREGIDNDEIYYAPMIIRVGEVRYDDSRTKILETEIVVITNELDKSAKHFRLCDDSSLPDEIKLASLTADPIEGSIYDDIANELGDEKFWMTLRKELPEVLANGESPLVFRSPPTKPILSSLVIPDLRIFLFDSYVVIQSGGSICLMAPSRTRLMCTPHCARNDARDWDRGL